MSALESLINHYETTALAHNAALSALVAFFAPYVIALYGNDYYNVEELKRQLNRVNNVYQYGDNFELEYPDSDGGVESFVITGEMLAKSVADLQAEADRKKAEREAAQRAQIEAAGRNADRAHLARLREKYGDDLNIPE